jgi:hypothetical protein
LQAILSRELSSQDEKCRSMDGPVLYRHQGASQWLVAFAQECRGASEKLQQIAQERHRQSLRNAKVAA